MYAVASVARGLKDGPAEANFNRSVEAQASFEEEKNILFVRKSKTEHVEPLEESKESDLKEC